MTLELFVQANLLETRQAWVLDGALFRIEHYPRLEPENRRLRVGDIVAARLTEEAPDSSGFFVNLGDQSGFIRKTNTLPPNGERFIGQIVSEARRRKLARLRVLGDMFDPSVSRFGLDRQQVHNTRLIGLLKRPGMSPQPRDVKDVESTCAGRVPDRIWLQGRLTADDWSSDLSQLGAAGVQISTCQDQGSVFEENDIDAEIEAALLPEVTLASGARLIIETTEALVAIDVDMGGARERPQAMAPLVAHEAARQISLRNLSGTIVVDFPGASNSHFATELKFGFDKFGLSGELRSAGGGLTVFVRPRRQTSLAERLAVSGITHLGHETQRSPWAAMSALATHLDFGAAGNDQTRKGQFTIGLGADTDRWLDGPGTPVWHALTARFPLIAGRRIVDPQPIGGFEILEVDKCR